MRTMFVPNLVELLCRSFVGSLEENELDHNAPTGR